MDHLKAIGSEEDNCENVKLLDDKKEEKLEKIVLHVFSLKCAGCIRPLEKFVMGINGVKRCEVNFMIRKLYIEFDADITDEKIIVEVMRNSKHDVVIAEKYNEKNTIVYFQCDIDPFSVISKNSFGFSIEKIEAIKKKKNIYKLSYNEKIIGIREIVGCFHKNESTFRIVDETKVIPSSFKEESTLWKRLFLIALIFGAITMTFMIYEMVMSDDHGFMITYGLSLSNLILFVCCTIVQIFVGRVIYVSAYKSLFTGINMDFLISTATSISYIYSCVILVIFISKKSNISPHTFFETPPMLYMIVCFGRWIESTGKSHTVDSIRKMMKPQRQEVNLIEYLNDDHNEYRMIEIDSTLLQENDYIKIYHGMRIPADGIIVEMENEVVIDESVLTGESIAVSKPLFSEIFSSCINEGSMFIMKVTKTGRNCRIQQISILIQEAIGKKIPMTDIVNVISKYFTPAILVFGIVTFVSWMIIFHQFPKLKEALHVTSSIQFSFQTAISVLCVACPCALGLAIPLAIMITTGIAAKYGIFIKGGPPIQLLHRVTRVVFDKTGTITFGKPKVAEFFITHPVYVHNELDFRLLYSLSLISNHILCVAIKNFLEQKITKIEILRLKSTSEVIGKGIMGIFEIDNKEYSIILGNEALLVKNNIVLIPDLKAQYDNFAQNGSTIVFAAINQEVLGFFVINDEIRPDAKYTISNLKALNIKTTLLSGDREETTKYVAEMLGFDEYHSRKTPEEKSHIISLLVEDGEKIAMIGDGVNDSIALSHSTVGIAMGSGSDITAETADVVLMNNKLSEILNLMYLSVLTVRAIKRNLIFSSVYNILAVPIAAGCLKWAGIDIQPWVASIAMVFSSVSVTGSSLVLKLYKPKYAFY